MKKVAFYTLGCKLNFSETSTISRQFENKGFQKVSFTDTPDIFVINTCSVTDHADKKCKKIVKEAKKISPDSFVAIVGCYAQLKPKEISEIEGVDAVLGASEKFQLLEYLDGFIKSSKPRIISTPIQNATKFHSSYAVGDRTRAFLKVQDGCNYGCSFCTIPLARGKSRSESIDHIVNHAKEIAAKGVREIVLSGVNIGDFGIQDGRRKEKLLDLLLALDAVTEIQRFRVSSIEPNLLTNEIIHFVASSQRFVPHFHVPLQSGNDRQLKQMNRRYLTGLYADRIQNIKHLLPHACIGADVITGFPDESEEDFKVTYRFIQELPISYLHVFTYSERENTPAAQMSGIVPVTVRQDRTTQLRSLSEKLKHQFYQSQLGSIHTVLFEDDIENGKMHGFTENYVRVEAAYDPLLINELKKVRLDQVTPSGLVSILDFEELEVHI